MEYDLVFEGGGAKGMVFVGALQEFEKRGHKIGRLLGTSAGAITATLLTVGYDSAEMLEAMKEELNGQSVFVSFMSTPEEFDEETVKRSMLYELFGRIDIPWVPQKFEDQVDAQIVDRLLKIEKFRHLFSFLERGGWYAADYFLEWLKEKMDSGTYNGQPRKFSQMNFAELYEATGQDLSLIAADVTDSRMLVLNRRTAPQCPVVWATRMSMSIPLLWQEVVWQKEWGTYDGRDITGHAIVDGGLLSNFPIALFISKSTPVTAIMGSKTGRRVIGMMIDDNAPLDDAAEAGEDTSGNLLDAERFGSLRTFRRILQLVTAMIHAGDKLYADHLEKMILRLPAGGYGTTEFDMSDERRMRLVKNGRQRAVDYFLNNHSMVLSAGDDLDEAQQEQVDALAARMLRL